ncbi:MAG: hypothetical protein LC623_09825 [Halobacteriales archaeon]|nr:hypothetical protein [Halobacteriales archaeon]
MRTLAIALSLLMLAVAVAPSAAAQGPLPPNPFNNVACIWGPGGGGLIGFVGTLWLLTCGYALSVGYYTYDFACTTAQGGGC